MMGGPTPQEKSSPTRSIFHSDIWLTRLETSACDVTPHNRSNNYWTSIEPSTAAKNCFLPIKHLSNRSLLVGRSLSISEKWHCIIIRESNLTGRNLTLKLQNESALRHFLKYGGNWRLLKKKLWVAWIWRISESLLLKFNNIKLLPKNAATSSWLNSIRKESQFL